MSRILLVDDEMDIAEAIAEILGDEGYTVRVASNGREALAALAAERPDLLITDVMMPVMDGAELLREVRANPALRGLPIIVISAGKAGRDVAGADALFLPKPFDLETLLRVVAESLQGARAQG